MKFLKGICLLINLNEVFVFSAVKNSSIYDTVPWMVGHQQQSEPSHSQHCKVTQETCDQALMCTCHRLPKGSKMVFRGGRRQKENFIYENIFFRSHLSHYNRIQLDKVWLPFELKRTKGKFQFFHAFFIFDTRFGYKMSILQPFFLYQHICPIGFSKYDE